MRHLKRLAGGICVFVPVAAFVWLAPLQVFVWTMGIALSLLVCYALGLVVSIIWED